MSKITSILLIFFLILSCSQKNNCYKLPEQFVTYQEALTQIKSASFKIKEDVNTSKSSWIKDASFYSCDGITGFFILKTYKEEYIFNRVE